MKVHGQEATDADACLIAAAPDLLEACHALFQMLNDNYIGETPNDELDEQEQKALKLYAAATEKAGGRSFHSPLLPLPRTTPHMTAPADIHDDMPSTLPEAELRSLISDANDAIGAVLVKRFPEAESGDESPLVAFALNQALAQLCNEWVRNNVPAHARP